MSHEQEITYTLEIVTTMTRMRPALIERCVEIGVVSPAAAEGERRYTPADVARLRRVRRFIQELGLNWAGVEIVLRLTEEIDHLQAELDALRAFQQP